MRLTVVFLALLLSGCSPQAEFELFRAETPYFANLPSSNPGALRQQPRIFRLNKSTGETWALALTVSSDGIIEEYWTKIPEYEFGVEFKVMERAKLNEISAAIDEVHGASPRFDPEAYAREELKKTREEPFDPDAYLERTREP